MMPQTPTSPDYNVEFSDEILEAFKRYSAERSAKYLMPHLRPGMRLIDVGCGHGVLSMGLARAVAPGELHGVDLIESRIRLAETIARENGLSNASFHVGDPLALPFEDDSFDVAHCHNVLTYIPDTGATLAEIRRVLKPGGIVACRELITDSCFTEPDYGVLGRAWALYEDILAADDAHPQMGKDLKGRLVEAGFENIEVSASFDLYETPDDKEFIHSVTEQWFLTPEAMYAAIISGAATQELCDQIRDAYTRWKDQAGAFCALAWGEAVADNP